MRWIKADYLEISKRRFLVEEDTVFYLREYTVRQSYTYSETNRQIRNLQKGLDCNRYERGYRNQAINLFGHELRSILDKSKKNNLITAMPPRQSPDDDLFDNRLELSINLAITGLDNYTQIRFLENRETRAQLRDRGRRDPNFLNENFILNDGEIDVAEFDYLIVVDDTYISGCSIRAVSEFIGDIYPDLKLVFIAWAKGIETEDEDDQLF